MNPSLLFLLILLLQVSPSRADRGDLFLDLGAGTLVQEQGRRPAMAGNMAFRFGAGPWTEVGLGVDYGRFLNQGGIHRMEMSGLSLAAFLTPYPNAGRLQPLVGGHLGMIRVDGRWRGDMGLEARALADLGRHFQGYVSVDPGVWMGDGGTDVWVKLGLGARIRLGY